MRKTKSIGRLARDRREFLFALGGGLALGGVGTAGLAGSGLEAAFLGLDGERLDFGEAQRLVDLLTVTPLERLQPLLVEQIHGGVSLEKLTAAGALANARAFGGQDYNGYHAFMALIPALQIAREDQGPKAALPVLKVLYRNAQFIHDVGAQRSPSLTHFPEPKGISLARERSQDAALLAEYVSKRDMGQAEAYLDELIQRDPERAFEALIPIIWMEVDVHRVVLAWRAWDMQRLTGKEHARTLLRQSIRQCIDRERDDADNRRVRSEMPEVLEGSGLMAAQLGSRALTPEEITALAEALSRSTRMQGAQLAAESLAAGARPADVGQALSLACSFLMLRQRGRTQGVSGRPVGSVHGAGTGIHASDTAAAWRGMANFGSPTQCKLALVAGAYHTAGQGAHVADHFIDFETKAGKWQGQAPELMLQTLAAAIVEENQSTAAAMASAYASAGHDLLPFLAICRDNSVRAEGALHAEKYYRTQAEVIASDHQSFVPLHAAALARVCASQAGQEASGREQALKLLG